MPYYKTVIAENTTIYVWKLSETLQELSEMGGQFSQSGYEITAEKKQKERLALFALLKIVGITVPIHKEKSGRPYLADLSHHISISHNAEFVVFGVNKDQKIGIDVELVNRNFEKVASKYSTEEELQLLQSLGTQTALCLLWSAKESAYKTLNRPDINFKTDLKVLSIDKKYFEMICHKTLTYLEGFYDFYGNSMLVLTKTKKGYSL